MNRDSEAPRGGTEHRDRWVSAGNGGLGPRATGQTHVLGKGTQFKAKPSAGRTRVPLAVSRRDGSSVPPMSRGQEQAADSGCRITKMRAYKMEMQLRRIRNLRREGEVAHSRLAVHIHHASHAPAAEGTREAQAALLPRRAAWGRAPRPEVLGGPTPRHSVRAATPAGCPPLTEAAGGVRPLPGAVGAPAERVVTLQAIGSPGRCTGGTARGSHTPSTARRTSTKSRACPPSPPTPSM